MELNDVAVGMLKFMGILVALMLVLYGMSIARRRPRVQERHFGLGNTPKPPNSAAGQ